MNIFKHILLFSFCVTPLLQAQQPAAIQNIEQPTDEQNIINVTDKAIKDAYEQFGLNWTWRTKLSKYFNRTSDDTWTKTKAFAAGSLIAICMAYGKKLVQYSTTAAQATYTTLAKLTTITVDNYKITLPVAIGLGTYAWLSQRTTKKLFFGALQQSSVILNQLKTDPFFTGTITLNYLDGYILKNFNGNTQQAITWYTTIAQQINNLQKILGKIVADTQDETLRQNSKALLENINKINTYICKKLAELNKIYQDKQTRQAAQNAGLLYYNVNKEAL